MRDHPIHLVADDDMEFRSGSSQCYDSAVDYMMEIDQCGLVQCKGTLGGSKWGDEIRPSFGGFSFLERGVVVRMIGDGDCTTIFPDSVLDTPGRYEDIFLGHHHWTRGYFVAKMFNVPTLHHHSPWGSEKIQKGHEGCQAVPLYDNGKNPRIVLPCMGVVINRMLGDQYYTGGSTVNMKRMLSYRPKFWFWRDYVQAAIRRFGYWALEGVDRDLIQRGHNTRLTKLGIVK